MRRLLIAGVLFTVACDGGSTTSGGTTTGGGGTTTGGGGTTNGGGGTVSNGTLTIVNLSVSPSQLVENHSVTVSAIVTDSAGLAAIAGGTLSDANGQSYGAFSTAGGQGTFSLSLSWGQAQNVSAINLPAGGGVRALVATFFDNNGGSVQKPFSLALVCSNSSDAVCNGVCKNLSADPQNCGACGASVPAGQVCDGGSGACLGGKTFCTNAGCYDLQNDVYNCGACGNDCLSWALANGLSTQLLSCQKGVCCANGTCGSGGGADPCQSCMTTVSSGACKSPYNTCNADPSCKSLRTCLQGCANATCADQCYASATTTAGNEYDAFGNCVCASCAMQCSANCM